MDNRKKKIESEIDYKDVVKNPIRTFPFVFVYIFTIALLLGIYFVHQIDTVSFNTVPGTSLDTLNVVHDIPIKKGEIKPAVDLDILKNPTNKWIAKGKKIFESTCASCHGKDGKGDGIVSAALNPKPRNFHSKDGWTNGRTFYDMYKTVKNGVKGTGMTGYDYLPPANRIAVILFIRTMADFPKVTDESIAKLDKEFNLSKGVYVPNQISIKLAIKKIEKENKLLIDKVLKYYAADLDNQTAGAKLFEKFTLSPKKSLPVLILNFKNVKTVENFISSISYSPEEYGFKSSVINLSSAQWEALFSYFREISTAVFSG